MLNLISLLSIYINKKILVENKTILTTHGLQAVTLTHP